MTSVTFAGAGALVLILAILLGAAVSLHEANRRDICYSTVLKFLVIAMPLATLSARALYAMSTDSQIDFLVGFSSGWSGKTILYGAVAGALAAALLVAKIDRIRFSKLLDTLAPGAALAIGVGRLASFFNGSCFGQAVNADFLKFFPVSVYVQSISSWLFAVFVYEASMSCSSSSCCS